MSQEVLVLAVPRWSCEGQWLVFARSIAGLSLLSG